MKIEYANALVEDLFREVHMKSRRAAGTSAQYAERTLKYSECGSAEIDLASAAVAQTHLHNVHFTDHNDQNVKQ